MKTFVALLCLVSISSYAQDRELKERSLISTLNQTRRTIMAELTRMPEKDLMRTEKLLEKAMEVATGLSPNPEPIPAPAPIMCSDEIDPTIFQLTFSKMREFAYSGAGLDLSDSASRTYALDWLSKNPCQRADLYISTFKRLKNFAYSGTGLNMSASAARSYAVQKIETAAFSCRGF